MKNTLQKNIPEKGIDKDKLLDYMKEARSNDLQWQKGKAFCLIYHPGEPYASKIKEAYNLFFSENALNPMAFPSLRNFEAETVNMVAGLMNGDDKVCGNMTSGGTESILLAVKTARDYARKNMPGIKHPEIILPETAHPAFDKACHFFNLKPVHTPVNNEFKADIESTRKAITKNTIMLIASAPSYPHGVMDPVENFSGIALEQGLLLHIDACIGGFMLPFMRQIGYKIPEYNFELDGVTSISVDIHKYGYSAKGASVILYKNNELKKNQFFVQTTWPGGIYGSTAISGTKPGGAIAAAWAALNGIGMDGYLYLTRKTLDATKRLKKGIEAFEELTILGSPDMSIIAFTSHQLNIYEVADELTLMGWQFERLQNPAGIHLTVNQIHEGVVDEFLESLYHSVEKAKKGKLRQFKSTLQTKLISKLMKVLPKGMISKIQSRFSNSSAISKGRSAPMYGMMGALNGTDDLDEIVLDFLDKIHKTSS